MVAIIDVTDLENYPGVSAPLAQVESTVERINALVTEAWANPAAEVPQWVREIAMAAAARFLANPKGLQSWTRSIDDASRTERASETSVRAGLYLTDDEIALLAGATVTRRRVGSIRLAVPGY